MKFQKGANKLVSVEERIQLLPEYDEKLSKLWEQVRPTFTSKIIVLDDDPTGVQTVHGVPVFTNWEEESIEEIFDEERQLVFILTNSRAFSKKHTEEVHTVIAERISKVAQQRGQSFLLISRSDSTLRGHYPLETEVLKNTLEKNSASRIDGEIIIPFFKEGGRLTIDDVHYVLQNNRYVPAAETEFALDRMFSFSHSNLKQYVEEKTAGQFSADQVISISLDELRALNIDAIKDKLMQVTDFRKVIVNAYTEEDLKVFSIALIEVMKSGKKFIFRTAASFTKVIGNISSKPLLPREQLVATSENGGLIVIGSHVKKTTEQLTYLQQLKDVKFIEFHCALVSEKDAFEAEIKQIQQQINDAIAVGQTVCVYTSRELLKLPNASREAELAMSVEISNAVTSFVRNCLPQPRFVIAKGGITSSDVGTNGLGVKKAEVLGQVAPGVPAWLTDTVSIFPNMPYIIFPGNVGEPDTLKEVVGRLI